MTFSIDYDQQPLRFLKQQDKHIAARILDKIEEVLPKRPVSHNAVAIVGEHNIFRIRVGNYRVLYRINYERQQITVVKIDKRSRAYD